MHMAHFFTQLCGGPRIPPDIEDSWPLCSPMGKNGFKWKRLNGSGRRYEKHEEDTDLLKTDAVVENTRSALICTTSCLADIKNIQRSHYPKACFDAF